MPGARQWEYKIMQTDKPTASKEQLDEFGKDGVAVGANLSVGGKLDLRFRAGSVMRFDLTRPCGDCPFRSDKPFHMRPDRVRQILGGERGKAWWPTSSFPCHRTIIYGEDENGDEQITFPPTTQQCAGVMAILHRENRPNDAMQIAERLGMWNPATLDPTAPFYESTEAAIRGQEAMVRFGDIRSVRQRDYVCPHCGHVEHTRRLYRLHMVHAHSDTDKSKLTHRDRATLSGRAKRIKVTLAGKGKP